MAQSTGTRSEGTDEERVKKQLGSATVLWFYGSMYCHVRRQSQLGAKPYCTVRLLHDAADCDGGEDWEDDC